MGARSWSLVVDTSTIVRFAVGRSILVAQRSYRALIASQLNVGSRVETLDSGIVESMRLTVKGLSGFKSSLIYAELS